MTDTTIIHYDIRAVSGVTRAACGIDNHIDAFEEWQASNNRNVVTCPDCMGKIEMLARFGGEGIRSPKEMPDEQDRLWFKELVKEAADEYNSTAEPEFGPAWQSAQRDIIMSTLEEYHNAYFLSQRKLIMEAVAETIAAGKLKFDEAQLRGQIHQVLNSRIQRDLAQALADHRRSTRQFENTIGRQRERQRELEEVFNRKLAEASYLVGKDFMESDKVKERLVEASGESLESFFGDEDVKDFLNDMVAKAVEEAMQDKPLLLTQNMYVAEGVEAEEVYRNTRGLLESRTPPKDPPVNFNLICHAALGDWAAANDIVDEWKFDTSMTRRILELRQKKGELIHPGEDEPRD